MPPLKLEDAVRLSDFCKKLIEFDSSVVLVAIINNRGRILEIQTREHFSSQLDDKDLEMLSMQRALQTTMIKESDDKLGIFNYTLTKREKFYEYTAQFEGRVMLVIIDSVLSFSNTISFINKINSKSFSDFKLIPAMAV